MIYKKLFILATFIASNTVYGQIQRNAGQFVGGIYSGTTIETFSSSTEAYPEENYLIEEWMFGSIDLINTDHLDIKQIALKFNIVSNKIEIKTERVVKEIPISLIRKLEISNPNALEPLIFVNGSQIGSDGETLFEELNTNGRFNAYVLHAHDVLPADYNAQFDTGSKVARVVLTETYYVRDTQTSELIEIKLRRKNIIKALSKIDQTYAQKVKKYDGDLTDKYDLKKLMSNTQL